MFILVDGRGAGFGNLEIIVNGGRVTSHVHTISKEQFKANFIPHDPGRHRVDVKFNGEKVPNSPWFVEVKDPNTPLLAPMLVANRGSNGTKNGYDTVDSKYGSANDLTSSSSKLNNSSYSSFQQNKTETNNFSSSYNTSSTASKFESNLSSVKKGVDDLSVNRKKHNSSSDFQKTDFGSFSLLETPKLLSGSKSSTSKTFEEERKLKSSSSMDQLNSSSNSSFTPKTTYSTTIERSINAGSGYSSLNKPHEARVKGLTNGSSTMPKSSTLNKSVERRSSLHAKVASAEGSDQVKTNGVNNHSRSEEHQSSSSSYNATTQQQTSSFQSATISSSLKAVQHESKQSQSSSSAPVPGSPKLSSYKGTAEKCKFVGETVRHFNAGKHATFELFAPGAKKGDVAVNIISKSSPYTALKEALSKSIKIRLALWLANEMEKFIFLNGQNLSLSHLKRFTLGFNNYLLNSRHV